MEALSENTISQKLLGELNSTIWQKLRGENVDYFYFQINVVYTQRFRELGVIKRVVTLATKLVVRQVRNDARA